MRFCSYIATLDSHLTLTELGSPLHRVPVTGEKRNPYVPSNPDEVYAETGWSGWVDFLNGPIEDLSTILDPNYKRGVWLRGPLSQGDDDDNKEKESGPE